MPISPTLSTAELEFSAAGAVSDGERNVTLVATVRDGNGAPLANCQVRVKAMASQQAMIVDHDHVYVPQNASDPPENYVTYTNALGVARFPLAAVFSPTGYGPVPYLVEAGEDTPDVIQYTESADFLSGFRNKPTGFGYIVGTIPSIPFSVTYTTHQTIDDAWFTTTNQPPGSRTIRNAIFAAGATLAYTVDLNNLVRFSNCVLASTGNYSLTTQGRIYTAGNCGFRGGQLSAVRGEGGTHVRCAWDLCFRDAFSVEQGSSFTATAFYQCRFQRLGQQAGVQAYAFRGTPMRNVTADHCWFDLAGSPNVVGIASNVTEVGGARGPRLVACWIEGGTGVQVASVTGASNSVPEFLRVRACRFGPGAAQYVLSDCPFVPGFLQGNVDHTTGVLLADQDANETPGPVEMFPLVALSAQPIVNWLGTVPGGGGGGGGGPIEPGTGAELPVEILYAVTPQRGEPVGGGGPGGPVIRARRIDGSILPATPVLLGSGGSPPHQPLVVTWDQATSQMVEGTQQTITARLSAPSAGGVQVPYAVTYGAGATPSEFVLPAAVVFPPGATIAQFQIQSIDDQLDEGDETLTLTLLPLVGPNQQGETITLVEPGTANAHVVTVLDNDFPPGVVGISFGITALTVSEGPGNTNLEIPINISGNPSATAHFRVTVTGTATLAPAQVFDFVVNHTPVAGTTNVYAFQFNPTANGAAPGPVQFSLTIIDDIQFGVWEPDETIILTLTSMNAGVAEIVGGPCTITIEDDQLPPSTPPFVSWQTPEVGLYEGIVYNATLGALQGVPPFNPAFGSFTQVRVQVIPLTATYGEDFDLDFGGGFQTGALIGLVNFGGTGTERLNTVAIAVENDGIVETGGEEFILRILPPETGDAYQVGAHPDLRVRIFDPLGGGTTMRVQRIAGIAGTTPTLVSCTVPVIAGLVTPANGWRMDAEGALSDCQWYPAAYDHLGEPDAAHIWGLLPGAQPSEPLALNAINVHGGNTGFVPPLPIDITAQIAEVTGSGLRLTLRHNVNGENRDFVLPLDETGGIYAREALIDPAGSGLQGGGPRFFARYRVRGELRASAAANDACTVARVYMDFRADVNAVRLKINWRNNRWARRTTTDGHKVPNDRVDGEMYFDYLDLDGVPPTWAAVALDPRPLVSEWDSANSRVRIIKPVGGTVRHYVPPLRGHIAYVVLYRTSGAGSITQAQATAILNGDDIGEAYGPLGIDRNDVLGEHGFMCHNYGTGTPGFVDRSPSGVNTPGWAGSAAFVQRQHDRLNAAVVAGNSDKFYGPVQRGWWLPFGDAEGGSPGGDRIDITGAVYPGRSKRRKNMLEMVHLEHRVGMVPWTDRGEDVTDEDFCVAGRCATAMWRGIGAQRMMHQHFAVPDTYAGPVSGIPEAVKLGPGLRRAVGQVAFSNPIVAGDNVTITSHVNGWTFEFANGPAPADVGTTTYVGIVTGAGGVYDHAETLNNFYRKAIAKKSAALFPIHPRRSNSVANAFELRYAYHGTVGNAATVTTTSGSRVTVTDIAGGLDTNAAGAPIKPWNYLVHGSNSCNEDMFNDWHAREINEGTFIRNPSTGNVEHTDLAFHAWDWPHMSRMNEVTRDGWWLYLDPIAHDVTVGLMHLATQCFSRFPEGRSDISPFQGTGNATAAMLGASTAYSSLALIEEGLRLDYLKTYVENNHYAEHPASIFAARVAGGARNFGFWCTRNPTRTLGTLNPAIGTHYTIPGDWPIDRGWGWAMATVARGYAIDAAHRATIVKNLGREALHPPGSVPFTPSQTRPSWFELMREVIKNTMHACGAPSSNDFAAVGRYDTGGEYGPVLFNERRGAMPGRAQNDITFAGSFPRDPAEVEDEWYAIVISWQNNFVALGAYAIGKRVYQWVGRTGTQNPNIVTASTTTVWWQDLSRLWRYILLLMRSAAAWQQPQHFFMPSFPCVGSGTPHPSGIGSTGDGRFGRFNAQAGTANPELTSNAISLFWWTYGFPIPPANQNHDLDYYANDYFLWVWMYSRLVGATFGADALNLMGGLARRGGGTVAENSVETCQYLKGYWQQRRYGNSAENDADKIAWVVQWHRNEFVPLNTPIEQFP